GVQEKGPRGVYQLLQLSYQRKFRAGAVAATQRLSRILLGPVAGQLTSKRLVVVADGALQYIPFAALTAPRGGRPLIAEHEIVNLPSVSALGQLRQDIGGREPAPKTIIAVADPIYGSVDARFKTRTGRAAPSQADDASPLAAVTRAARDAKLNGFPRLF